MVLGILQQLVREQRKPKRPLYKNVMGLQRINVNGKTMIVRRVIALTERGIVVEDATGKIVTLPLEGEQGVRPVANGDRA